MIIETNKKQVFTFIAVSLVTLIIAMTIFMSAIYYVLQATGIYTQIVDDIAAESTVGLINDSVSDDDLQYFETAVSYCEDNTTMDVEDCRNAMLSIYTKASFAFALCYDSWVVKFPNEISYINCLIDMHEGN